MAEKAVLISIRPKWCREIITSKKTYEVRKSKPKLETPFKCYIYQTLPKYGDWNDYDGRVIGEFVCDDMYPIRISEYGSVQDWNYKALKFAGLSASELATYIGNGKTGYAWHISDLHIYENPQTLHELQTPDAAVRRAPQSWMYVADMKQL